jgi:opacity protein-like surface antigen
MRGRGKRTKQMVSVKLLIAAAAAVIVSTTARAADMPLPAPQIVYQQPPCCDTGRWYLRGDVGVGVQTFGSFNHGQTNSAFVWPSSWTIVQQDIQDTSIFGAGIGYAWNNWLRFDVTGEYRTKALMKATGSYTNFCPATAFGPGTCFDNISGNLSSAVFLANAYADLGTWWCLTPFIGAGVGGARNMLSGVQDQGIIANGFQGFGYTSGNSAQWNLAWDVTAGLTYNVNENLKVDLSWRYLNLGSPQTSVVNCQNTSPCAGAFYTLQNVTSQDFRVGLRWLLPAGGFGFGGFAQSAFAPAAAQYVPAPAPQYVPPPQYVPAPAPQYMQPPLSSRG